MGEDAFTDYISADVKLNTNLATEMIMLCTVALNVLIFQNCKMVDSFSSSDEDGLTCLLDVVGGGEVPRDDLTKNVVKDEIDEEKYYSAVSCSNKSTCMEM